MKLLEYCSKLYCKKDFNKNKINDLARPRSQAQGQDLTLQDQGRGQGSNPQGPGQDQGLTSLTVYLEIIP